MLLLRLNTLTILFFVLFSLWSSSNIFAQKSEFDTGKIKVIFGHSDGGFIDELYLDRNQDSVYSEEERIILRPEGQPGLVVSYTQLKDAATIRGVAVGNILQGKVKVQSVSVQGFTSSINGLLDFQEHGSTPFEVKIKGQKNSSVLTVDFLFSPLSSTSRVVLREATLRLYGVFDEREPNWRIRSMSTGNFRNTPRPNKPYQFLVWQLGGKLVENPWYWREWTAWSNRTGPITVNEGGTPGEELSFYMQDNFHGIQAYIKEPADIAPVELMGNGYPSYLAIHAWTPRTPGYYIKEVQTEPFYLKGIGIDFYNTGLGPYVKDSHKYHLELNKAVKSSLKKLRAETKPAESNLRHPEIPENIHTKRIKSLKKNKLRNWINKVALKAPVSVPIANKKTSFGENWLNITLDTPSQLTGKGIPARGGVPFLKGALKLINNIRMLDGNGKEIPIQVDRLASWPDKSVKWALITTFVDVKPNDPSLFKIEFGPDVKVTEQFPDKIIVNQTQGGIVVETGALKFQLNKNHSGLFDELWFDSNGDKLFATDERVFSATAGDKHHRMDLVAFDQSNTYAPYAYHTNKADYEPSEVKIEDITIERIGPLVAHLLVKGRYHYQTLGRNREKTYQNKGNEFWLRYTVYAGKPFVEIKHSYVFEGNPDLEMIHDLSISLQPNIGKYQSFTTSMDQNSHDFPLLSPESTVGIIQDNPYSAQIYSINGSANKSIKEQIGGSGEGWATLVGSNAAITFGVRHFREKYAKELAFDNGELSIGLWPRSARYLDTRRYSRQYVDGESTSYGQGVAQGVAQSHDMFFYFHSVKDPNAEIQSITESLLHPVYLKASPAWYTHTQAAGLFEPYKKTDAFGWEQMMQDGLDYFLYHQKLWAWYGIYDFGDFQQVPNNSGGWAKLAGRWGWSNNEALIDMWIYEQFLQTGRRDYLDAALALTRHTQEVDLINSHNYKGNTKVKMHGHRHNVNHWGDGYVGIRVAAPHGFRLGYYLTGDLRIYDQLKMSMEAHWNSMYQYDKDHSTGLGLLMFFWEATGEEKYKVALDSYINYQVAHFKKFGHIHGGVWRFEKDQLKALGDKPLSNSPTNFFFQNFGAAYSLMEFADLTGRQDLIDALIAFATDTIYVRGKTWPSNYCHYRLMAFAYRHTGDKKFLSYGLDHAKKLKVTHNRKQWSSQSAIQSFDNKLSMLAWAGQGLPYLLKAIELRKNDPVASFKIPSVIKIPEGHLHAQLPINASASKAKKGSLKDYQWSVDKQKVSTKVKDTLDLSPGLHQIILSVTDSQGRTSLTEERTTVWNPSVVTRLCFRGTPDGFLPAQRYSTGNRYGYLPGTKIVHTSEPRNFGGQGCKEVYITGRVRLDTGSGKFSIEMGGKDFWTEQMGSIEIQGKPINFQINKPSSKKIEWGYQGELNVSQTGSIDIDFIANERGKPVVLAYIIVKKN